MDDAINAKTKERVHADALAKRRGWRTQDYVCPGCRNPVYLRKGKQRAPHFAHLPGYDTQDCSYYYGGGATGGGGSAWENSPAPLPLFLQVRTETTGPPVWNLQLAIPRTDSPRGRIVVVDGISGPSRLSCSELANGGKRVSVRPQASSYQVQATAEVSQADAERLEIGSPGLDSDAPTLFRAGLTGGRRLPDDDDLTWGESYFAVWESARPPGFPPGIPNHELTTVGPGYRAGVFQLPHDPEEQVREWVAETLYRRVSAPGVSLSIVTPLTLPGLEEEHQVDSREDVVVALLSPGGTEHLETLTLVDNATGIVRRVDVTAAADVLFVNIGALGRRRVTVSVENYDGDSEAELEIQGRERALRLVAPSSFLVTRQIESGVPTHTPLHSRAAAPALVRVRDGEATLEDLIFPPSVPCDVRVSGQLYRTVLNADVESKRLLVAGLRQLLSDGLEVAIDAQSFGCLVVPARPIATAPRPQRGRLTTEMRRRIRALTNLSVAHGSGTSTFLDSSNGAALSAAVRRLDGADALLLQVLAHRRWSLEAVPQLRTLAAEITRGDISQRASKSRE